MEGLLQSFCYGDNECLLSPHLKCSEVCFEKGVWGFLVFFFPVLCHMVGTKLRISSQSVLQCCLSCVIQGNDFWKALCCSLALCVLSQHLLFKKKFWNVSSLSSSYLGLIVHLYLCVFPAWVDCVSQQREDNILKLLPLCPPISSGIARVLCYRASL